MVGRDIGLHEAADVAIHLWYSAFVPPQYSIQHTNIALKLFRSGGHIELGRAAKVEFDLDDSALEVFASVADSELPYSASDALAELERVR